MSFFSPVETKLPNRQPLQSCPGVECFQGRGRCVAMSAVCDKTVDCLAAEDEMDCPSIKQRAQTRNAALASGSDVTSRQSNEIDPQLKFYSNKEIINTFKYLNDSGVFKNLSNIIFISELKPILKNNIKFESSEKIFNDSGLMNETRPLNVTRMLELYVNQTRGQDKVNVTDHLSSQPGPSPIDGNMQPEEQEGKPNITNVTNQGLFKDFFRNFCYVFYSFIFVCNFGI